MPKYLLIIFITVKKDSERERERKRDKKVNRKPDIKVLGSLCVCSDGSR